MIKQTKLPNHNTSIIGYFSELGKQHPAVMESKSNWYWFSDLLKENVSNEKKTRIGKKSGDF